LRNVQPVLGHRIILGFTLKARSFLRISYKYESFVRINNK
jgi:hypothetical protein